MFSCVCSNVCLFSQSNTVNNIKESDEAWSICAGYKPAGDSNTKKTGMLIVPFKG